MRDGENASAREFMGDEIVAQIARDLSYCIYCQSFLEANVVNKKTNIYKIVDFY